MPGTKKPVAGPVAPPRAPAGKCGDESSAPASRGSRPACPAFSPSEDSCCPSVGPRPGNPTRLRFARKSDVRRDQDRIRLVVVALASMAGLSASCAPEGSTVKCAEAALLGSELLDSPFPCLIARHSHAPSDFIKTLAESRPLIGPWVHTLPTELRITIGEPIALTWTPKGGYITIQVFQTEGKVDTMVRCSGLKDEGSFILTADVSNLFSAGAGLLILYSSEHAGATRSKLRFSSGTPPPSPFARPKPPMALADTPDLIKAELRMGVAALDSGEWRPCYEHAVTARRFMRPGCLSCDRALAENLLATCDGYRTLDAFSGSLFRAPGLLPEALISRLVPAAILSPMSARCPAPSARQLWARVEFRESALLLRVGERPAACVTAERARRALESTATLVTTVDEFLRLNCSAEGA